MKSISTLNGIIDFAVEKEAEAEALYKSLADQVKIERSKNFFTELAIEEHGHYERLTNLDIDALKDVQLRPIADLKMSEHLQGVGYSDNMSYQDILVLAIKNEEHAHSLYQGVANNTKDAQLKQLFEFLAQQESHHKLRLETEYDEYILTED